VQDALSQRYPALVPWLLDPDDPVIADYVGRLGAMLAIEERASKTVSLYGPNDS
jgi:hypothetical protein